jgi:hypothetical protein
MLYCWFYHEGWVVVLSVLNLGLALFTFFNGLHQNKAVWIVEKRFFGLEERLISSHVKISDLSRRVTGTHEAISAEVLREMSEPEGNDEDTHIKKIKKQRKENP